MSDVSSPASRPLGESRPVRLALIGLALLYLAIFLFVPLVAVFAQALEKGWRVYVASLTNSDAWSAIKLTLLTASIAVPLNAAFGVAAAWCVARFRFRGRQFLTTLIDLPLAISPVISGLIYVLMFGLQGWLGPWLQSHDVQIIFAVPGIVLATVFVTFPFVAREIVPFMQSQGADQEEAASVLGAGAWSMFWRVTLPNIKWSLMYGVVLCCARAIGEFGAVSVVSGHISGQTNTVPLQVEILYNEYNFTAAFALSSLLTALAVGTLIAKKIVEWRSSV
jgi:sulfate transport system permease protein